MIVVSDTTPLISLMKIGQLKLINQLFGDVKIPQAVFNELVLNPRFPEESKKIKNCPFIDVVNVEEKSMVNLLRRSIGLDLGESEAIILADTVEATLLLMDEVKGRQVALQMEIPIMGTIGILLAAYKEGLLSKIQIMECIELLKKTGRHISDGLYRQLINKISD